MKAPLLCDAAAKSKIETANGVDQLDYISSLVTGYKIEDIRESQILELHKIAVNGVFGCGGTYRDALVHISNSEHKVPEAAFVPSHVQELLYLLNDKSNTESTLHRAAYALWRFNWIHPFRGGNGRTSRALAYMIVCMGLGRDDTWRRDCSVTHI